MKDYTWTSSTPHADNEETMRDYLVNHNMLDIHSVNGTYAEGSNCKGELYGIHAGGDGDFLNHRISFELIENLIPNTSAKITLNKHIIDSLNLIEECIQNEPQYVNDFNGVKSGLEDAYSALSFPLHD